MSKSKKDKKAKGQVMSLADFVGPTGGNTTKEDDLNWALDRNEEWEEEGQDSTPGVPRVSYARTAGEMRNFRDAANAASNSRIVDYNMEKPYLGFVANLLTNLPDTEVRAFFADADLGIDNIKMIYKERSTFAFVEFESPQALQMALLLQGKFLKGRPVKVDIATQDQREKMMNDKARGMLGGRDGPKSPNSQFPDRDAMGSEQRSFNSDRRGPRSNTSANPPRDFGDFSRDAMGSVQQPENSTETFGSRNGRTPNSSGAAAAGGFPNFRDTDRAEQPQLQPRMPRMGSRDNVGKEGGAKESGSWRGSKAASPNTRTEGGSWRDSAKVEQPQGSWRDQPAAEQPPAERSFPQRAKKDNDNDNDKAPAPKPAASAGKTLQIGGETQPQPKKELPKPAPAPKVSAWGDSNKLSSLRNKE